ncbi:MAG: T9SS type A sorting domain-containing protein [Bacteroidia bacterium]
MIKKSLLLLLLFVSFVRLNAQITITREDYAFPGDFMRYETDTPAAANISTIALKTGLNKTWDFSTIPHSYVYDSVTYSAVPANAPVYTNLLVKGKNGAHYEYADSSGVKMILDRPNNNMLGLAINFLKFPITYGNSFRDSLKYGKYGTPFDFNAPILGTIGYDSLRAQINVFDTITCIASGLLILPDTSCQVILVKISSLAATNLYGRMPTTGWRSINSFLGLDSSQRTIEYQWLAKGAKGYMARALLDPNGTVVKRYDRFVKRFTYPFIKNISPISAAKGKTIDLQINCSATSLKRLPGFSLLIRKGNFKLPINSYTITNDTTVIVNITLLQLDSLGTYDVRIVDPLAGLIELPASFTVLPFERTPKLLSVSIKERNRKSTYTDTLICSGTHFTTKANTVTVKFTQNSQPSSSIKTSSIKVINDSMVSFTVNVDSLAAYGVYGIQAYNWIDSLMMLDSVFRVAIPTGNSLLSKTDLGLEIFPNPAKDFIEVMFNNPAGIETELKIFTINGACIKQEKAKTNSFKMNVDELPKGVYLLMIKNAEAIESRKFLLE